MPRNAVSLTILCLGASAAFVVPATHHPRTPPPRCRAVDAKLNGPVAKKAILSTVSALVLAASPMAAHAKGGGHGGGGGGHSGGSHSSYHSSSSSDSRPTYYRTPVRSRSRSRSSTRSYSTGSSSYTSAERSIIFPTSSEAREKGGLVCPANLARAGELVDIIDSPDDSPGWHPRTAYVIESRPPVQSTLYGDNSGAAQPLASTLGSSSGCELVVRYADDGTTDTISAAKEPPSVLEEAALPIALLGYVGLIGSSGFTESSSSWDNAQRQYDEMKEKWHAPRIDDPPPPSGEYWGATEEEDAGDQAVRVTLQFGRDGRMTGRGKDGVDGSYKIREGIWWAKPDGAVKLAWKEVYDEGFTAICFGTLDPATAKISARFASSRNVGGSFSLKPKPSAF